MIERRIEISNSGGAVQPVALYAAATIDGTSFLGSEGRTVNELSSWTTVTPAEAEVAAGGSTEAVVKILRSWCTSTSPASRPRAST